MAERRLRIAVIFDNDGTVMDTEQVGIEVLTRVVLTWSGRDSFNVEPYRREGGQYFKQIADDLGFADRFPDFRATIYNQINEVIDGGVQLMPGARELTDGLKEAGVLLGIASQTPIDPLNHRLVCAGIRDDFDAVSGGDQVRNGKPHPGIFQRVADQLRVPYRRCVVLGDMDTDIEGAIRAGMGAIKVSADPFEGNLRYRPHMQVGDLTHLNADSVIALAKKRRSPR